MVPGMVARPDPTMWVPALVPAPTAPGARGSRRGGVSGCVPHPPTAGGDAARGHRLLTASVSGAGAKPGHGTAEPLP